MRRPQRRAIENMYEESATGVFEEADQVADAQLLDDTGVEDIEGEFTRADEEVERQHQEDESFAVATENLITYINTLEHLVATKSVSIEALNLVKLGAMNEVNRFGITPKKQVALEGVTDLKVAAESLSDFLHDVWHSLANAWVLQNKQSADFWTELFTNKREDLARFEGRLNAAKKEFNTKRASFKEDTHRGNLTSLWYHFSTEGGELKDVPGPILKDVEMSHYVLDTYESALIALYKQATGLLKSATLKDLSGALKLAKSFEGLKHPAELFDQKFLKEGGKPFLSVTGLELDVGSRRDAIRLGAQQLSKLADLATPKRVIESGSFKHGFKQAIGYEPGGVNLSFIFKTDDIEKVLDAGLKYVDGGRKYLAHVNTFKTEQQALDGVLKDFEGRLGEGLKGDEGKAVSAMLRQIQQYMVNINSCFKSPAIKEISRALKSAKFCDYLGLRMIYQAK